jgi:predicted XRE-type DNA-binding protein
MVKLKSFESFIKKRLTKAEIEEIDREVYQEVVAIAFQKFHKTRKNAMPKEFEQSSGNIFEDLQLPNAKELLAKAKLVMKISSLIKKKKLTQKQVAAILKIEKPEIFALLRGHLADFSLERIRACNDKLSSLV